MDRKKDKRQGEVKCKGEGQRTRMNDKGQGKWGIVMTRKKRKVR